MAEDAIRETAPNDGSSKSDKVTLQGKAIEVKTFEDLLLLCGEAGRWQLQIFLFGSFCGFLTAFHNLSYAFIGAVPEHWCKLPSIEGLTLDETKKLLIPLDESSEYEQCFRYYLPWDNNGVPWTNETLPHIDQSRTVPCSSFEFVTDQFTSTVVTDFDLVCGSYAMASAVQAIYMIGTLFGSPIFGAISDKIGRRKAITIASFIFIPAGPLVALAPNFETLMLARFIMGAAVPRVYVTALVLAVETVGTGWRGVAGNLFCLPFALGYMTLPAAAYFFRDWRSLQLVLSAPSILQIIACWAIPESPRWLLRKGKVKEAEDVLRNAASVNGRSKKLPGDFQQLVEKVAEKEIKVTSKEAGWTMKNFRETVSDRVQLIRNKTLRTRILVLHICWASISMVYYGVALNSPNLSADRYLYTFVSGVLEIPSYTMVPPLIKYLGRRKVFSAFQFLCGVSLLGSLLFGPGSALIVTLALVGKLLIGAAAALIYLYATELLPTLFRTFGIGSAMMAARLGSASAPFIVDLLGRDDKTLPTLVFGVVSVMAALLSLLLPETNNKRLPETVSDVEENRC